ncbi:MAG: ABC transporter permease [Burkholderiaceae bacterium]|nr:ABC transporter permease [Burkholderiaceae bacterium]
MPTELPLPAPVVVPLRHALAIQRRVIWALLMREVITRFGRRNLGVLWLLGEPMLFTVGVAALWIAAGLHGGKGVNIVVFAITGYSSVLVWRNTVSRCTHAIQQNFNLLYHRGVRVIDVLLTRVLLELGGASGSFLVLSCIALGGEWIEAPADLARVLIGWAMLAWLALGLGLTVGALSGLSDLVERIWHPLAYLLFPLSGAAFLADWLPAAAREVIMYLPMVHGIEYIRSGWYGPVMHFHHDLGYMAVVNLALLLSGLWLTRYAAVRVGSGG